MSDDDAYMALALFNAQKQLNELEVGLHALRSGLSGSEYARRVGISQPSTAIRVNAARVSEVITRVIDPSQWRQLSEIHAAPRWLWQALAVPW